MCYTPKQINQFKRHIRHNPEKGCTVLATDLGIGECMVRKLRAQVREEDMEVKEQDSHAKAQITVQKLRDTQRIERAAWRSEARVHGEIIPVFEAFLEAVPKIGHSPQPTNTPTDGPTLLIQLSDLHIGQTITLPNNHVDTKVLSQRLFRYAMECIKLGEAFSCRRAVILLTGDICTSDRRAGELAAIEYNRSHALLNAFEILSGFIDLISSNFKVSNIVSVLGNEARLEKDLELGHKNFFNNFDWIVHQMLEARYNGAIQCAPVTNPIERVLEVDGVNICMAHGLVKAQAKSVEQFAYYKAKYPEISYLITGHVHQEMVTLNTSRSSGLPGANEYSTYSLGFPDNNPGQTCHIVQGARVISVPVPLNQTHEYMFLFTPKPDKESIQDVTLRV